MPKTKTAVAAVVDSLTEGLVRRLSSITERLEELKEKDKGVRESLFKAVKATNNKTLITIYGTLTIKETKVYNFEKCVEVTAAREALEVAKAQLKAAEDAAKADAPYEIKETLTFNRNKAVSARAKKGRIYIRSFFRRAQTAR
jgi:hypothetical protein